MREQEIRVFCHKIFRKEENTFGMFIIFEKSFSFELNLRGERRVKSDFKFVLFLNIRKYYYFFVDE